MKRICALPVLVILAAVLAAAQEVAPPAVAPASGEEAAIAAAPPAVPALPVPAVPLAAPVIAQAAPPALPAPPAAAVAPASGEEAEVSPAPPAAPVMAQAAPPAPPPPAARPPAGVPPVPPVPPVSPAGPVNWYGWGKGSYLGIGVQEVDDERAKELKLPEVRGVEVTTVAEDSPAAKAGMKEHDVVLEYNGERVEGVEQFVRMVRETPPGRQVKLVVSRNGANQTLTATVGDRKQMFGMNPQFQHDMQHMGERLGREFGPGSKFQEDIQHQFGPDSNFQHDMQKLQEDLGRMRFELNVPDIPEGLTWKNRALGVEAESVSSQLADFFGVKQGVLVRSVVKDTPAEKAGIQAGDVITRVGNTEVSRPGEISRLIRNAEPGKPVPVTVVRNKQQLTLNVTIERKPETSGDAGPRRIRRPAVPRNNFFPGTPVVPGRLVALPGDAL